MVVLVIVIVVTVLRQSVPPVTTCLFKKHQHASVNLRRMTLAGARKTTKMAASMTQHTKRFPP